VKLRPYPEYKDSGVQWLGKVPAHWKVKKLRHILVRVSGRNRPDLPLLSVVREKGVIQRDIENRDENHNFIPDDLSGYKVVRSGRFAMNKMKAWQGSYGVSSFDGIVSPAYFVFKVHGVEGHFFHAAIRSRSYIPFFTQASDGVRIGQWDLSEARMKEIPFFIPSLSEQTQIARFLDWKTAQIDRFIRNKRRLIELLKEQKQALINQAVTGRIDVRTGKPYPGYKESSVPWLGKMPVGWDVLPIRRCARSVKTGGTPPGADEKFYLVTGLDWYTPGDFSGDLYLEGSARQLSDLGKDAANIFPKNTVMMIGIGATIGKVAVSKKLCSCNQQINAIIPNNRVIPEYLALSLRLAKDYIVKCGKFTTMPIINQDETKSLRIPLPDRPTQKKICAYIRDKEDNIDTAITRTQREINLMQEYRTRLIADVVTGKLDVRGVVVPDFEKQVEGVTTPDDSEIPACDHEAMA